MKIRELMKKRKFKVLLFFVALLSSCSAITHEYGPYYGKVVDAETREPLEGAVIVFAFYTEGGISPGGIVSDVVDVKEVLTDHKGEFSMPSVRYFRYRVLSGWKKYPLAKAFKSGYGCFPDRTKSGVETAKGVHEGPMSAFQPNQEVTILLPRLVDIKERKNNLSCSPNSGYAKAPMFVKEKNKERVFFGLEPL